MFFLTEVADLPFKRNENNNRKLVARINPRINVSSTVTSGMLANMLAQRNATSNSTQNDTNSSNEVVSIVQVKQNKSKASNVVADMISGI